MSAVVDASIAAAWLLPEEDSDAAEALIAALSGRAPVPSLFWHEARNILIMAERRGRIVAGEAVAGMGRLRRLPLEDAPKGYKMFKERQNEVTKVVLKPGATLQ